jgi:hypothetical protein
MPDAFDESVAREACAAYSVFTDIVISGSADPATEWRDFCEGQGIPMPELERQQT